MGLQEEEQEEEEEETEVGRRAVDGRWLED